MKSIRKIALVATLILSSANTLALAQSTFPTVGEEREITKSYQTSEQASDGSSSTSSGHDTLLERVIRVRPDGFELEYDLPRDATAQDRERNWQFPARVFKPLNGSPELLNAAELESRVDGWLAAAGWSRAVCEQWIFTWNAFRIECDPESVIKAIEAFDLRTTNVGDGETYRDPGAKGGGTLKRRDASVRGQTYTTTLEVDVEAVRRSRAEADIAIGEIIRKEVALDVALRNREKEAVSGTISITLDTDEAGNVWRRTKVTKLETRTPDGVLKSSTATEIVTSRVASQTPS